MSWSTSVSNDESIRVYELHRWFNPFAKQRAVMITPTEPEEIAEALRPHLFTWRYSHIPYDGLYGSIKNWGFVLKRSMFQQPALKAKYGVAEGGTRLDLELGRSLWGVIGWGLDMLIAPFAVAAFTVMLLSHDILGPPRWIDTAALWQSGNELPDQPAIWILFIAAIVSRFVNTIKASYRQRNDLDVYKPRLVDILDAREVRESA